ncbi:MULTISPECIES: DUF6461 domain-containing protein [Streptomyces]|uniref:DUF6461 domain-containing protein n=1 Tax=Streptomyces glycanivorans TaxID=3033808 RepID=A0ABY9J540_9ACTN|nr:MULTISPECIES: DUF6461 domain-containing protein [unclassified Streptomyces]WSQ75630.1 DUF6461 domain-containing protein [Streptomyces sp. NBC_01213]TXS08069.1 hypothetical protein EAO68_37770 [Streptomyces sp. wa22]WLQ62119.1 DUF6461 domain-containing protein [Streptomyces sp. Alt3]WSR04553.1 DUF6461 domain-containing protein [Streptomyces sp. NBC_01208]WSR52796.1 DUF6461 domain-containing protein [Streptomyces sp. NBC_01201]
MDDQDDRFDWIDEEDGLYPVLTLVEGVTEEEVLRGFGGDPEATRLLAAEEIYDLQPRNLDRRDHVGVGTVGDTVFALEVVGSTGAVPGVLRNLSRGGRCFGLLLGISGGDRVFYAVDGDLVVYEEPYGPVTPLREGDARWDPFWCAGLIDVTDPTEFWGLKLFLLAERVMGVTIERSWFTRPLRTAEVPDPLAYMNTPAWDIP